MLAQGDCDKERAGEDEADEVEYEDADRAAELDTLVLEDALRVPDEHLLGNGDGDDERLVIGVRDTLGVAEVLLDLIGVTEKDFRTVSELDEDGDTLSVCIAEDETVWRGDRDDEAVTVDEKEFPPDFEEEDDTLLDIVGVGEPDAEVVGRGLVV